jgi:peptidoglycan glycosyltransferase
MVTASAALDSGAFTPTSGFNDPGYCVEYGKHVSNAGNPDQRGPESYGHVTLAQGFQHSINSVFCNVGKQIGAKVILDYAKRFGFYSTPPLETPANQRLPSGLYKNNKLWFPKDPATEVDPGRLAFGQERLQVTPLQMLMVGATIANGGVVPRPYIVDKILGHDGSVVSRTRASSLGRAIKSETAAELNQMMVSVVQAGTGTAAQIPGIQVAGKTGTAETGVNKVYTAWFVSFAPADNPQVAVAVVLEKQLNGFGGAVSAPIAKQIMQKLLSR